MLDFSTFNLLKCNISSKKKTFLNVGPKVFYSDIFGLKLEDATNALFEYLWAGT